MGNVTIERMDNLFWLGRYIERVYQMSKDFAHMYDILIDGDDRELYAICEKLGIAGKYTDRDSFLAGFFDPNESYSIIWNLTRAFDNAVVMRDEISTAALSYIHLSQSVLRKAASSEAPLYEMQKLEDYILAFWGALDENVDSEETRAIVKCGKRLERLDFYTRFNHPQDELRREMQRLMNRLAKTSMPYNRSALMHAAATIEDDEIDYKELLGLILRIF